MLLLTIAYTLLFIAQFYIAYMVGIFSLLYFAGLCVVEKRFSLRTIGKFFCQRSVGCGPQRLFMAAHLRTACLCIPSGTPELFYRRCDFFKNFQQDLVWQL